MVPGADGRQKQVMFPCNVFASMLWVNVGTFETYGMKPPPAQWTFADFERIGKEFVRRANRGKDIHDVYFVSSLQSIVLMRSLGLSYYNETLTASRVNDPRYIRVLNLLRRWMDMDIIPTESDRQAFSNTQSGYGGSTAQLFNSGNYAMLSGWGRFALIQFRVFNRERQKAGQGPLKLAVIEYPHGGFRNTTTGTRAAAVYAAGKNKQYALLFEAFLASKEYNMQIVDDADALPPNPKYTKTEEFLRPKKYPNEWGCHEAFSNAAATIGIGGVWSPYMASPDEESHRQGDRGRLLQQPTVGRGGREDHRGLAQRGDPADAA